jgi:hypothetical protein
MHRVDNCFMPDDSTSRNWTFQHNTVYNSWGEGIDCIQVVGCTVRQNVVYDTFSVNICTYICFQHIHIYLYIYIYIDMFTSISTY